MRCNLSFFTLSDRLFSFVLDNVEGLPCSAFPIPIYEYDPLRDGPIVTGWYDCMKSMMDNGIVHRLFDGIWKLDVMVKKGKKRIKEQSREELFAEFGVRVLS